MKKGKKILLLILGLFLCLLLIGLIYLDNEKDKIIPYLVESINSNIEGELSYEDINLIPFKHFPDVSVTITSLQKLHKYRYYNIRKRD